MPLRKLKLVNNWKDAWRWFSVHCMVIAASVQGAWVYIPEDLRTATPTWLASSATIIMLGLGVLGRLVYQPPKKKR